jgi:hypothetical protein
MFRRKRLGKSMTEEEFFEGFEAGKLEFGCAWCTKPIDNQEFRCRIRLPTNAKELKMSPSEAQELKRKLWDDLTHSPVMKLVMVADDAIYVDYWYCSKKHKEAHLKSMRDALAESKKK